AGTGALTRPLRAGVSPPPPAKTARLAAEPRVAAQPTCCSEDVTKGQLLARAEVKAAAAAQDGKKPNILVIFGDDIGQSNISAYTHGLMGYRTPNIDRIAKEGMIFTDYYAEQSCTAGRS